MRYPHFWITKLQNLWAHICVSINWRQSFQDFSPLVHPRANRPPGVSFLSSDAVVRLSTWTNACPVALGPSSVLGAAGFSKPTTWVMTRSPQVWREGTFWGETSRVAKQQSVKSGSWETSICISGKKQSNARNVLKTQNTELSTLLSCAQETTC